MQARTKISESDHGGLLQQQNYCTMYKSCTETRLSEIVEHFEKGSKNQNGATFFQIYQIFWKVLSPKIFKATFSFSHIKCSTNWQRKMLHLAAKTLFSMIISTLLKLHDHFFDYKTRFQNREFRDFGLCKRFKIVD